MFSLELPLDGSRIIVGAGDARDVRWKTSDLKKIQNFSNRTFLFGNFPNKKYSKWKYSPPKDLGSNPSIITFCEFYYSKNDVWYLINYY
jgi:hypothetical protein